MPSKFTNHVRAFIDWYWKTYQRSPTIRDIKHDLDGSPTSGGNVSTNTIRYILAELGYIKSIRDKGLARQITPEWVKKAIKEANIDEQQS